MLFALGMTYELAKELKEAGFTQKPYGPYIDQFDYTIVHAPGGQLGTANDWTYAPTLEELIEACGERFGYLSQWEKGNNAGSWQCISRDGQVIVWAATPTEAVARLWLALNKK